MISWPRLRELNGSQQTAFEELCTQLARYDTSIPAGSKFIRKGRPDAGVECYWKHSSGEEKAWQAKFFLYSPNSGQWAQCDTSIRTALEKHPDLVHFVFCFPVDLPDARKDNEESAQEKWDSHVEKWRTWADEKGMNVEFELWNGSYLVDMLSRPEHRGRLWFWFGTNGLTQEYFLRQFESTKADLNKRYNPDLHMDVHLETGMNALVLHPDIFSKFFLLVNQIVETWQSISHLVLQRWELENYDHFNSVVEQLVTLCNEVGCSTLETPDYSQVINRLDEAVSLSYAIERDVWNHYSSISSEHDSDELAPEKHQAQFSNEHYHIWGEIRSMQSVLTKLQQALDHMTFAKASFLILTGEAGIGKSHILAHLVESQLHQAAPALMFLGEYFTTGDPWQQMIAIAGLDCSGADTFLGALDAAAEAYEKRALIVVDALNEYGSVVHRMWKSRLAGLRAEISRWPHIAFAVSIRTPFEDSILPETLKNSECLIRHRGFAGNEREALLRFCEAFSLPPPGVPRMLPEFRNPLFLLMYCEALRYRQERGQSLEFTGLTEVIDSWIDSAENRASEVLGTDPYDKTLKRGISSLALQMAEQSSFYLERNQAKEALESVHKSSEYSISLFKVLLNENIVQDIRFNTDDGERSHVRFQYEKVHDVFVARAIIESHLTSGAQIGDLGSAECLSERWVHPLDSQGLFEALAILLPLQHDIELTDIAPQQLQKFALAIMIDSIPWRSLRAISSRTVGFITEALEGNDNAHRWKAVKVLLYLAGEPNCPMNAEYLHNWLSPMSLPERDSVWSYSLLEHHDDDSPANWLLSWCSRKPNMTQSSERSLHLISITLGWILATSHRPLRDKATKTLVQMFHERTEQMLEWLRMMMVVNDPYIIERVTAVAYGAIVRSKTTVSTGEVALELYRKLFSNSNPPEHILTRDYARNTIEYVTNVLGTKLKEVDLEKVRPPYKSDWCDDLPSFDELQTRFGLERSLLLTSMVGGGDFDRYEVGSNSWHFPWVKTHLHQPLPLQEDELMRQFKQSLDPTQKDQWELILYFEGYGRYGLEKLQRSLTSQSEESELEEDVRVIISDHFRDSLNPTQLELLDGPVRLILDREYFKATFDFSLDLARRWLLNRVLQLGWDESTLGKLDSEWDRGQPHSYRTAQKPERLGKKYQWIALHQFLGVVSDHFRFRANYSTPNEDDRYDGPWQVSRRDIDPTCLIRQTFDEPSKTQITWWSPVMFEGGRATEESIQEWLHTPLSLPDPRHLFEVKHDSDGTRWYVHNKYFKWSEELPSHLGNVVIDRRSMFYLVSAYLVQSDESDDFFNWAKEQDFHGRWMPGTKEVPSQLMLRECGWAPSWSYFNRYAFERPGWSKEAHNRELPCSVLSLSDTYFAEDSTHDCSIDKGYSISLPCQEIVDKLELIQSLEDGHYIFRNGDLAAYDPSICEKGPSSLLIRQEMLAQLNAIGLNIVWVIQGEQHVDTYRNGKVEEALGSSYLSGAFCRKDVGWEGSITSRKHHNYEETEKTQCLEFSPGTDYPNRTVF